MMPEGQMVESMMQNAVWVLFIWVLANQAGLPVPVSPSLLAAGTLVGSGHLSFVVVLAAAVAAALGADLIWYGLGRRWGIRSLASLVRVLRQPPTSVGRIRDVFRTHQLGVVWSARFLPELNPVAAGLAGATGVLAGAISTSAPRAGLALTALLAVALALVAGTALALRGWRRRTRRGDAPAAQTWLERLLWGSESTRDGRKETVGAA
jgi:membrane protein DedA with SNARE-associated domain